MCLEDYQERHRSSCFSIKIISSTVITNLHLFNLLAINMISIITQVIFINVAIYFRDDNFFTIFNLRKATFSLTVINLAALAFDIPSAFQINLLIHNMMILKTTFAL